MVWIGTASPAVGLWSIWLMVQMSMVVAESLVRVDALDSRVRISGNGIAFDAPGVQISASFKGTSWVSAVMTQEGQDAHAYEPNYFNVYIDSQLQTTFNTKDWMGKRQVSVPLFAGRDTSAAHVVTITKITEAQFNAANITSNYVTIWGFEGSPGLTLKDLPAIPERKIEFLGDSITAGFCNAAEPCDEDSVCTAANQQFNSSWASLTCQALGAQCHVQAWSGRGVAENCCNQSATLMSDIWLRTLASVSSTGSEPAGTSAENLWDFRSWVPDVLVLINLGTNDVAGTAGILQPSDWLFPRFNATYLSLLTSAARAYGTSTRFILACGPMSSAYCASIEWVMAQAPQDALPDLKVSLLDQTRFLDGSFGPACNDHPSAEVDAAMAD
eukprot:CAMPEP_0115732760 /NCGR_PEP_ID=MMETSP0272-20121206/85295_1 /TAXON_ID=71861 /ORGANISM="Scrippsiella trochoidea, Strain CCMP3099" /LENGTH=385 /DNA_ID=CAMNT_0003176695 /DNA_START=56 /DNA_END=1212 /DNA_ORIENTATION=+